MASTALKAAPKTAAKKTAARTVCVHRNAAGNYDCNKPRHLSKTGKPSGRMCDKHEAEWRAAAKLRYAAAHPKTEVNAAGIKAIKAQGAKVAKNSGGQVRPSKVPPVRPMGSGPVARAAATAVELVTS